MFEKQKTIVERLQKHLQELPLLPAVVLGLLRLDPNSDRYFEQVSELIGRDPAFASRVMKVANSAAMGANPSRSTSHAGLPGTLPHARGVTRIRDAVMRLGARGAVDLVVVHSVARVLLPKAEWERNLWVHALTVGLLAQRLSRHLKTKVDAEGAYLAGLLHDLGRFILYLEAPAELRAVDETDWESPAALVAAEKRVCGFTHVELGFMAAQKWQLPGTIALVIQQHHAHSPFPPSVPAELVPLIDLIRVADAFAILLARLDWAAATDEELEAIVAPQLGLRFTRDAAGLVPEIRAALTQATTTARELGF